jgi:putative hydrolase of the HAD superfamily
MPRALLVDLYNTLVSGQSDGRRAMVEKMGTDLGVDPRAFAYATWKAWPERMRGMHGDLATETAALAARVSGHPTEAAIEAAVARRLDFARSAMRPEPSALAVIAAIRAAGWRVAIVSNCTLDSADAIRDSVLAGAVDALVLSAEAGIGKPDPEIYRMALDQLDVDDPAESVYLGDGADDELRGAARIGLRVIKTVQFADTDPSWDGEQIENIAELPGRIGVSGPPD